VDEAQAFALALYRLNDRFAPPSEADNRGIDHERGHPADKSCNTRSS
jgi:hypothetical protein